jgi:hypothetical protein
MTGGGRRLSAILDRRATTSGGFVIRLRVATEVRARIGGPVAGGAAPRWCGATTELQIIIKVG